MSDEERLLSAQEIADGREYWSGLRTAAWVNVYMAVEIGHWSPTYQCWLYVGSEAKEWIRKFLSDGQKPPRKQQYAYFIYHPKLNQVKIGISVDPHLRLADLQVAHSAALELIAILPGGREREKDLHRQFAEHHLRGEWYHYAPEIDAYLRSLEVGVGEKVGEKNRLGPAPDSTEQHPAVRLAL